MGKRPKRFADTEAADSVLAPRSDRVYRNPHAPKPEARSTPGSASSLKHNPFAALGQQPSTNSVWPFEFDDVSPHGHRLVRESTTTSIAPGNDVRVIDHPLETVETIGFEGQLLGFTIPHGYACIHHPDAGRLILVHPEAIELCK